MSGWDRGDVYHANLLASQPPDIATSSTELLKRCIRFFENFHTNANVFTYREEVLASVNTKTFLVSVNISHVQAFDEELMNELLLNPQDTVEQFEEAARYVAKSVIGVTEGGPGDQHQHQQQHQVKDPLSSMQVQIVAPGSQSMTVRSLDAGHISKFVRIPGIVVSTASIVARPVRACIRCRSCGTQSTIPLRSAFGAVQLPAQCPGPQGSARHGTSDVPQGRCPRDSFFILPEHSQCVDQQSMKLQEAPDAVPVGELPRHVLLVVDRALVNRVTAGTRVIVNGVYSIMGGQARGTASGGAPAIRTPFMKVLGMEADDSGASLHGGRHRTAAGWSEEEEQELRAFSQQPDLYDRFAKSIAPPIFGCDDIKRALVCLLFGGSKRVLPDGIRLRGDINVLLLGDPGTAKSQFLKFIERVTPIAVYTSGKGSSAAGLTASVIRDPMSGDFYLEGGAMVLADGGVVCIDEFDKMDEEDRVAIHEAMEQQTISIAKAGITTVLNSRASVLAAANPVFGRYDEMRSPGENIDFSTTILSRFDMIFLVKDEHNVQRDQTLARHVLSVHQNANAVDPLSSSSGEFDLATMRRFISYCRSKCAPRLSEQAAERLGSYYVEMRGQAHKVDATETATIPITVRQLEAIIRIAESLAKLTLSPLATIAHVDEAVRLFRASTMKAVLAGHSMEGMTRPDLLGQVERVEKAIRSRLPLGTAIAYRQLVEELVGGKGFPEHAVLRAVDAMCRQESLIWRNQRRTLLRQQ